MELTFSLQQIEEIAKKVVHLSSSKIFLLNGEMGAGKTTLIKAIAKVLGVSGMASSPTFSIVNEYQNREGEILYHFDLYRLDNEEEAFDIGIEEYFYSGHYCFIEWPEKTPNLIPEHHTVLNLEVLDETTRKLTIN